METQEKFLIWKKYNSYLSSGLKKEEAIGKLNLNKKKLIALSAYGLDAISIFMEEILQKNFK